VTNKGRCQIVNATICIKRPRTVTSNTKSRQPIKGALIEPRTLWLFLMSMTWNCWLHTQTELAKRCKFYAIPNEQQTFTTFILL